MLQLASFSFDVGIGVIIHALFVGACLCVPSKLERTDDIEGAISRLGATFVWATRTHAMLLTPEDAPTLETIDKTGKHRDVGAVCSTEKLV